MTGTALLLVALASTDPGSAPPAVRGADLELLGAVRQIAERVTELHGEKFDRPPLAVRAPDELRAAAAEIRALNALPRERLRARGRAWVDLGLGTADSPARVYAVLAADLAGIGLDPSGNRLLVDPARLSEADFAPDAGETATLLMSTGVRPDEPVVGHMLVHLRQLERARGDWLGPTTDGTLARAAWAEAEANLLALRYVFQSVGVADAAASGDVEPSSVLDGRLVPPGLASLTGADHELVRFVYEDGFDAAAAVFRKGGFPEVVRAAERRRTTAAILQADRDLRAASPATGPPVPPGLLVADVDSLGAHGIFVLVSTATGKDNLGLQAASAWIEDRLERLEPPAPEPPGRGITRWDVAFAGEQGAADFAYALRRTLEARFPGRAYVAGESRDELVAGELAFRVEREPTRVRLTVGPAPAPPVDRPGR